MGEEIKTSTGPIVPEHQKERWHGSGFDHDANTGGGRGSCSCPHKKTLAHRCEHIQCKRADMGVLYCARTITLVHADLHCHMKSVLFPLMPICVCTWGEVAQLHTALCCSVKFHHESHWRLSWFYQRCSLVEAVVLFGNVVPHPVPPIEHLSLQWKIPRANLLFVYVVCLVCMRATIVGLEC